MYSSSLVNLYVLFNISTQLPFFISFFALMVSILKLILSSCFSHVLFPYPSTGWAGCLDAHFSTFWCCMIYAISDFMEMLQPLSPCFEILTGTVLTWCLSIVAWFWDWILKKGSTQPSHHHSVELEFGLALTDWYRATHDLHRLAWINIDWHEIGMRLAWTCMGLIWDQAHNNSLFHFSFDFELWSERDK